MLYPQCPKITNASKLRFRALLAERYATGRVALVVWFFAASIVAALGGMESVLAEMNREDPMNHLDLPFGRCSATRLAVTSFSYAAKRVEEDQEEK